MRLLWLCPLALGLAAALTARPALAQPGLGIRAQRVSPRPPIEAIEPTVRVAGLVAQLANESPDQRQAAARSLLEMGPAIEPQVQWAVQHDEPAANFPFLPDPVKSNRFELNPKLTQPRYALHALEVIASHLEEQRQLRASFITLHYRDAPLTNVLADLGRQAGAEISVGSLLGSSLDWIKTNRVTVNLNRATYWQAMRTLEQSAGLTELYENLNRLLLIPSPSPTPPLHEPSLQNGRDAFHRVPYFSRKDGDAVERVPTRIMVPRRDFEIVEASPEHGAGGSVVSGPLRISLISAEVTRSLEYPGGKRAGRVTLTLQALAEPKPWNTGHHALARLDECVEDHGQSLLAQAPRTFPSIEENCYWNWKVPMEVTAPAPGRRIKTLKGQFNVALCVEQRYLSLTNLLHAQSQSREFDGLRVTVSEVSAKDYYDELHIDLSAPAGSPYAMTFADSPDWDVSFYDGGRQEMRVGYLKGPWMEVGISFWDELRSSKGIAPPEAGRQFREVRHEAGRDVVSWSLFFSKRTPPAILVWLTPPETRWLTVPFEFHDLQLP